jgi:hypothetical protein
VPDRERLLELALKGLEAERAKINEEIAQVKSQLNSRHGGGQGSVGLTTTGVQKKRTMSAAARKKISDAMKRRYAEMRKVAKKSA